jgi:RNA-dependent RNA polymerase
MAENSYVHLPFTVRYQLEVCLSHGYLNEYTMGPEFATRLAALDEKEAKDLLEYVATKKVVYYDAMKIFDIPFVTGATNRRIPKYCCYMRSAQLTPSTIYFNTPSVDITNRVIRHYIEYADRFLRVRFTDEKLEGRINPSHNKSMDEVFERIKRAMNNGITIGDRRYEFLAFGNSQFREHGAYFFASLPNLTAANIRAWMGHFSDIRVIAKHAARLGQCFSTTRAVTGCPVQIREIDDIERPIEGSGGKAVCFSDGVGRISKFLGQMIMSEFNIQTPDGQPPSVYQFRLGGCKGILTMWPQTRGREVHIRKSQYKFSAVHNGLEIIRHSQFAMASLNRQLILVLSALGVPDAVFKDKLRVMLEGLDRAMTDGAQAISLLQKYIDPNEMTLLLAKMVQDGFQNSNEPFVASLLELWRAWHIKYLKEKAKIVIEKGACLLGCVDETNTLGGYLNEPIPADATYQEKLDRLPEIFVQVARADQDGKYEVIEGPCIVGRNPSLHPGDLRVVKAVNVPALHHLRDVVVFAQNGDRDVPSMCSGGDLDGDDYLVIWDQDLLPKDWFREPMDYSATTPHSLDRDVTVKDITSFFVTYMKNDRLPQIAHAHLAYADYMDDGVADQKCLKLAALHSAAVDYNKSGIPAQLTKDLIPRKWPHFMEKKFKPKAAQYVSEKILGQLYDIVERVDFRPKLEVAFDNRLLDCGIEPSDKILEAAAELKASYDADMRRIMAQHEIKTEFEVWSTFVLNHANMSKDYTVHEELGRISSALREHYLMECYEKAGGKDFKSLAPLAVAMYKVTSDQMAEALAKLKTPADGLRPEKADVDLPLISFPWILQPILGKIANRYFDEEGLAAGFKGVNLGKQHYGKGKRDGDGDWLFGADVMTADGQKHAGEILELFHGDGPEVDPFSGLGDWFDKPAPAADSQNPANNSGANHSPSGRLIEFDFESESVAIDTPATGSSQPQETLMVSPISLLDANELSERFPAQNRLAQAHNPSGVPSVNQVEQAEEIIEVEGDVKPSALDLLESLLGK